LEGSKSLRQHYLDQVQWVGGAPASPSQPLPRHAEQVGSPNITQNRAVWPEGQADEPALNRKLKRPGKSQITGQIGAVATNGGTGENRRQEIIAQAAAASKERKRVLRATGSRIRGRPAKTHIRIPPPPISRQTKILLARPAKCD
jgi:hypothetical protein